MTQLIEKVQSSQIPDKPGSYQFKDGDGRVIYVGKALSLRNRLANYFQPLDGLHPRTQSMVTAAESVEWIVVRNEVEALILEHNLIQKFRPRFNIRMRDDKSYPFLAITTDQEWPKVSITRAQRSKGVKYFGPYPHAHAIREILDLILRTFPIRTCADGKFERHRKLDKPCLLYHIERCCGPCVGGVNRDYYNSLIVQLGKFLKGDTKEVVAKLRNEMLESANALNFEQAARLRDRLELITKAIEKQQMVGGEGFNADVFGVFEDEFEAVVQIFLVRRGRVVGRKGLLVDKVEDIDDFDLMSEIIEENYADTVLDIPGELIVPFTPSNITVLEAWLKSLKGSSALIKVAQRGEKKDLQELVTKNAELEFKRHKMSRSTDHNARAKALKSLAEELSLAIPPLRIECFDMSHIQGSNYVGSMVVMEDGLLKKSDYRRFKVNVAGNDDYGAMYEVLTRRFANLVSVDRNEKEEDSNSQRFAYPPSLIVIDGGKGQLSMAQRALDESGYKGELTLIGLAKQYEEVFVVGQSAPIRIPRNSEALYLLQRIRDEAHRFAITYHRSLRSKSMKTSLLDSVSGMGPARTKRLLKQYGSLKKLRSASLEELEGLVWLPGEVGRNVFVALHGHVNDER